MRKADFLYSPAGPVAGSAGRGALCWQSHQVRPGHSQWRRSRHARQIMFLE